jgi:hypothetical protein
MLLTNHSLTGALIALTIDNPLLIAPVALVSHYALDSTPHFGIKIDSFADRRFQRIAWIDSPLALTAAIAAALTHPDRFWLVALGTFFACLPDLYYIPQYFLKWPDVKWLSRFHGRIQWSETKQGIVTDLVWASLMIFLISRS